MYGYHTKLANMSFEGKFDLTALFFVFNSPNIAMYRDTNTKSKRKRATGGEASKPAPPRPAPIRPVRFKTLPDPTCGSGHDP